MALAASAARTGSVSRTSIVTMLIGATAVLVAGGGEKTETPPRSRLAVSPRPICRATWPSVAFGGAEGHGGARIGVEGRDGVAVGVGGLAEIHGARRQVGLVVGRGRAGADDGAEDRQGDDDPPPVCQTAKILSEIDVVAVVCRHVRLRPRGLCRRGLRAQGPVHARPSACRTPGARSCRAIIHAATRSTSSAASRP